MCETCVFANKIERLVYEGKSAAEIYGELSQEERDNPASVLCIIDAQNRYAAGKPKRNWEE